MLREILRELDDKISAEELDMMIEEIDSDGSGTVDFDGEYSASCASPPPPQNKSWILPYIYNKKTRLTAFLSLLLLVTDFTTSQRQVTSKSSDSKSFKNERSLSLLSLDVLNSHCIKYSNQKIDQINNNVVTFLK